MIRVGLALLLLVSVAAGSAPVPRVAPLDTPAPPGSAEPQLTRAADGSPILSWLEKAGDGRRFRYSVRRGDAWSEPITISEGAHFWDNWADVPSMAALPDGRLVAHWLQRSGPGTYDYDVRVAVSDPSGRTWTRGETPHRDGTRAEHGFLSFFQHPEGGLGMIWLDGRNMAGDHEADAAVSGAMTLRGATLRLDGTLGPDVELDPRVCECCPTAALATPGGVIVAYRDRSEREVRDIAISRLENGRWTAPRVAVKDNWEISACPVNGPALAGRDRQVALAWFTAQGGTPRVQAVFSADEGRTWGRAVRVDRGEALGRVAAAMLPDGRVLVLWLDFNAGDSRLLVRAVSPAGEMSEPVVVSAVAGERASGYPRLVLTEDEAIFAWTDTQPEPRVRVASASLRALAPVASKTQP